MKLFSFLQTSNKQNVKAIWKHNHFKMNWAESFCNSELNVALNRQRQINFIIIIVSYVSFLYFWLVKNLLSFCWCAVSQFFNICVLLKRLDLVSSFRLLSVFSCWRILVVVFRDKNTPSPYVEDLKALGDAGESQKAAKPEHVYMDAMAFGMGCCCLQLTFQVISYFLSHV